jgi:hypothetical protein
MFLQIKDELMNLQVLQKKNLMNLYLQEKERILMEKWNEQNFHDQFSEQNLEEMLEHVILQIRHQWYLL